MESYKLHVHSKPGCANKSQSISYQSIIYLNYINELTVNEFVHHYKYTVDCNLISLVIELRNIEPPKKLFGSRRACKKIKER